MKKSRRQLVVKTMLKRRSAVKEKPTGMPASRYRLSLIKTNPELFKQWN